MQIPGYLYSVTLSMLDSHLLLYMYYVKGSNDQKYQMKKKSFNTAFQLSWEMRRGKFLY